MFSFTTKLVVHSKLVCNMKWHLQTGGEVMCRQSAYVILCTVSCTPSLQK